MIGSAAFFPCGFLVVGAAATILGGCAHPTPAPVSKPRSVVHAGTPASLQPDHPLTPPMPGLHHVTVRGRLLDADGRPQPDARVVLKAAHDRVVVARTVADDLGRFSFPDVVAEGEVYVCGRVGDAPDMGRWVPPCDGDTIDLGEIRSDSGRDADAGVVGILVQGRVLSPAGDPLAGAELYVHGAKDSRDPEAVGVTDERGSFRIPLRMKTLSCLDVRIGQEACLSVWHVPGAGLRWRDSTWNAEADLKRPLELHFPELRSISLRHAGFERPDFARRTLAGWVRLHRGADTDLAPGPQEYRGQLSGHLPEIVAVARDDREAVFGFCRGRLATDFRLAVRDRTGPLAGAVVDLMRGGRRIASFATDARGELLLRGAPDARWEIVVSARGHVRRRATWSAAAPLELELCRLDATVAVSDLARGDCLALFQPGASLPVAVLHGPVRGAVIAAPAGTLEAVVSAALGSAVRRSCRLHTVVGGTTALPATDERIPIQLELPAPPTGEEWLVNAFARMPDCTRDPPRCWTGMGSFPIELFAVAAVERQGPTRCLVRVARTMRLVLLIDVPGTSRGEWFLRERVVPLGSRQVWRLEAPTGYVRGIEHRVDREARYHHGYSGPRLLLRSLDPQGFDRLSFFPPPGSTPGSYRLEQVPPGAYAVFGHLAMESRAASAAGELRSLPAWGGLPVRVEAAGAGGGAVADFAGDQGRELRVRIVDATGTAVRGAELRVRDPLREAWEQTLSTGSSLSAAAAPLPAPPVVRLDREGWATLPGIRAGWLELLVVHDDGRVLAGRIAVEPVAENATVREVIVAVAADQRSPVSGPTRTTTPGDDK